MKEIQQADNEIYPLAIRLSPYASERDIIDYVKKNYAFTIAPAQKSYQKSGVPIGKLRKKDQKREERNEFIYQNRRLTGKELMGLVNDKFGEVLDYGHIRKIISLENKKRKEV